MEVVLFTRIAMFLGNTNLIYSIIRSKAVFYQLANLPEDSYQLVKSQSGAGSEAVEDRAQSTEDTQGILHIYVHIRIYLARKW